MAARRARAAARTVEARWRSGGKLGKSRSAGRTAAFLQTLQNLGWRQDQNVRIDIRWLGSDPQRIQSETAEMIASKPEVIVSGTSIAVAQALRTSSTPIVFAGITDPVSQGFVKSLACPDSNATGFAAYEMSLGGKWIEALKELWPSLARAPCCTSRRRRPTCPASSAPLSSQLPPSVSKSPTSRFATSPNWIARWRCRAAAEHWSDHSAGAAFKTPIPPWLSRSQRNIACRQFMPSASTSRPAA